MSVWRYNSTPAYELYHHGILGQRWGKRNGPPYPLGSSDHSSSEKKAGWRKSLDKSVSKSDTESKSGQTEKKQGLTDGQKKAIKIGVAVVATALVTYGAYKLADSGEIYRLREIGKSFVQGDGYTGFKINEKYAQPMSVEEIVQTFMPKINTSYGPFGTANNCRRCTFAYELSRRGYNVKATQTWHGTGQNFQGLRQAVGIGKYSLSSIMDNFKTFRQEVNSGLDLETAMERIHERAEGYGEKISFNGSKSESIFNALSKMPNGSRGELGVIWDAGGGHSLAWEIIENKPTVFDFQTHKVYENSEALSKLVSRVTEARLNRLDNVDLDMDFLKKWVQNDNFFN